MGIFAPGDVSQFTISRGRRKLGPAQTSRELQFVWISSSGAHGSTRVELRSAAANDIKKKFRAEVLAAHPSNFDFALFTLNPDYIAGDIFGCGRTDHSAAGHVKDSA